MKNLVDRYRELTQAFRGVLTELEAELSIGRSLRDLELAAQDAVVRRGHESSFKGYRGFPAFITASLNDEILNTVPDNRRLKDGDLLKLQVGIKGGGAHAYQSWTYAIGRVRDADRSLIDAGQKALARAVADVRPTSVKPISRAIQETIEGAGFSVNRSYVGHGMGEGQHEPPQIPCYASDEYDDRLRPGQILSIQVIAHAGAPRCRTIQWNVKSADGKRAVIFSQMLVVGRDGPPETLLEPRSPYFGG